MKPVLLMTGHTFPELAERRGDFDTWFEAGAGIPLHAVDAEGGETLPDPRGVDGVIVTGSKHSVHEKAPWSVTAGAWLAEAVRAEVPVLGVCYGHQLLGEAFGGEVGPNPNGREIGVVQIDRLVEVPLFEGLEDRFAVVQTHSDAVNRPPPGWEVLARTDNTPVQAMRHGSAITVQWHPEMDREVIRYYLAQRAEAVDAELGAGTAARLIAEAEDPVSGPMILRNWVRHYLR